MKRGKPLQSRRRKCKACREWFQPRQSNQVVCSIACAKDYGPTLRQKQRKAEHRAAKERVKTRRECEKDAQKAFNWAIRERDYGKPCPSCGRNDDEVMQTDGWKTGGAWDCGHYLSVGSHPELRFEPLNAHRQCKSCNAGSGKYTKKRNTVAKEYRANLVDRIGEDNVAWLEGPHPPRKYTRDQLKTMATMFRMWARWMKREQH